MDRRDGGESQAPPRPPKLLPRIHKPRAPEPNDMLNDSSGGERNQQEEDTKKFEFQRILRMIGEIDDSTNESSDSPESSARTHTYCSTQQLNNRHQQQQQQPLNSITPAPTLTTTTTTTDHQLATDVPEDFLLHGNYNNPYRNQIHNSSPNSNLNSNNPNGTFIINTSPEDSFLNTHPDYDNYQIHHLTYLPQRLRSLSRNSSHVSTSSSSSITATNSFTRRRLTPTPGASVPLLTITGTNGAISSGSFLSHFHNADTAATPVTLAQPRPECQRHSNEYVDTPLRTTAQQLQHATRNQHPAGQHDSGQTTTHHVLLLPQRSLRTQHSANNTNSNSNSNTTTNTNNHSTIHSTRAGAGTASSANFSAAAATTTTGADRTDGFIHSQPNKSTSTPSAAATNSSEAKTHTHTHAQQQQLQTATVLQQQQQALQAPITKQPASSNFKTGHGDLLHGIHSIQQQQQQHHQHQQSDISANNNSTGTPIISTGHIAPNSITCPHCGMCRCEQCQTPRLLPERWLCNKTCLCSAETVIDYASCLCCAKAFFYHCARDSDMDYDDGTGTSYLENPCSCGPYKRAERLGWLGALSLVLPCLWCYWPMRGCAKLGQLCYGYVAGRGCRCTQPNSPVHMLSVMPRSSNGSTPSSNRVNNTHANIIEANNTTNTKSDENTDVKSNHHHYHVHHHHHDSKASQMLCEPEKRLLDSTHEF